MHPRMLVYMILSTVMALTICFTVYIMTTNYKDGFPRQFLSVMSDLPLTEDDIFVDDSEAQKLFDSVQIYCWILTTKTGVVTKAAAVNFTWAPRCNKHVFFASAHGEESGYNEPTVEPVTQPTIDFSLGKTNEYTMKNGEKFSTIEIGDVLYVDTPDGWKNLTEKSREILQYLYIAELKDFDWFLKADDDTYVIMENLRFYLRDLDPNKPSYMGYQLEPPWYDAPYMSGGAGYILSKAGLRDLVEKGLNVKGMCLEKGSFEDLEVGRCSGKAGVQIINSQDKFERETFHPDKLPDFIPGPPQQWLYYYSRNKPKGFVIFHPDKLPDFIPGPPQQWLYYYSRNKPKWGSECCSQFTISFHRMSLQDMLMFDHLLYKTSVYGRRTSGNIGTPFRHNRVKKLPNGIPTILTNNGPNGP